MLNITNKYRHTHKAKPKLMKWIYTGVIRPKLISLVLKAKGVGYPPLLWRSKNLTVRERLSALAKEVAEARARHTRETPMCVVAQR